MPKSKITISFTTDSNLPTTNSYIAEMLEKLMNDGIISEDECKRADVLFHTIGSTNLYASKNTEFDNFLSERNDALDNSTMDFIRYFADNEDIDWDMSLIGDVEDFIKSRLAKDDIQCCHPFTDGNDIPCYETNDCLYENCPFKKVKENDNEQEK